MKVMQTSTECLQSSNSKSFAKMSRLDVCKPIHLHNYFLVKYNNKLFKDM